MSQIASHSEVVMSRSQLRVALVGAGNIAGTHAEALRCTPSVTLAAVIDPARARAETLAGRWHIPAAFDDPAALGREVEVDVAHVLTPPPLHRATAEPLLRRGIHVLLEKPM